ncbi:MAG: SLBB domain-containing protein, partial [Armatimonadota bacterium]
MMTRVRDVSALRAAALWLARAAVFAVIASAWTACVAEAQETAPRVTEQVVAPEEAAAPARESPPVISQGEEAEEAAEAVGETALGRGEGPPEAPEAVRETVLPASGAEAPQEGLAQRLRSLARFGADLFRAAAAQVTAPDVVEAEEGAPPAPAAAPVPAGYVLGPGDSLSLRVIVRQQEQVAQDMTVSPEGFIFPEQLGRVTATGKTIEALREEVRVSYSRIFTAPQVTLSVSAQRTIEVWVSGDVTRPGRYPLTGMATILDALYAAGGPSPVGSYRRVVLTRVGAPTVEFDLYDYLLAGSRERDVLLNPGDTIFVPAVGAEVGLDGEVRRPARYELAEEATIGDVVAMAGGLTPLAFETLSLWRTE